MQLRVPAVFVLLCVCSNVVLGSGMKSTVQSIVTKDTWSVAEGVHDGKPLVIRFRQEFKSKPDVHAYPTLIKVSWSYHGGKSGMPDPETSDAMATFEDRLVSAVESDVSAVLVAVITNNNNRMWAYYSSSVPTFSERLHSMPQETASYPIEIEADTDPEWNFLYSNILSGMKDENP